MSALFGGFKTALEVFAGLAAFVAPTWQRIEAFLVAIDQLLQWAKIQVTQVLTPTEVIAVKDFSAAMSALFGGFKAALDVFVGLAILPAGFDSQLDAFLAAVWKVVTDAKTYVTTVLTSTEVAAVQALGSALTALFGGYKAALDVLSGLAALLLPADGKIDAFLAAVAKFVIDAKTYVTATLTPAEVAAVQTFGTALSALFGGYKVALDMLSGLAAFIAPAYSKLSAFLNAVNVFIGRAYTLTVMVLGPARLAAIQAFGTMLGALFAGYKSALDMLSGLAVFIAPANSKITFFLNAVGTFLGRAYTLTRTVLGPAEVISIQAFGVMLSALFSGYKAALDTLSGLAAFIAPADTRIDAFLAAVQKFIADAKTYVTVTLAPAEVAAVQALGGALSALFGGYKAALDMLSGLSAFVAPADTRVDMFLATITKFINDAKIYVTTTLTAAEIAAVQSLGAAFSALFGGYKAALDVMGGLAEFVTPVDTRLDAFLAAVLKVINDTKIYITANLTPAVTTDLAAFGGALNTLFTGLKAALDVFTGLATQTLIFDSRIDTFLAQVVAVMQAVSTYIATTARPVADAATTAFGTAIGAVFGGLKAAIDVFKDLQGYIPILNTRIQNFIASVTYAYGLVQTYAIGPGVQAGTTATTAFANATSAVFGALSSALGLFKQLVEGTDTPTEVFNQRMALLVERINGTLSAFKIYVTDALGTDWLPAANSFTTAVNAVLDVLKKALDLFVALDEHGLPSMAQLQELIDYTLQLFAAFASGLRQTDTYIDAAGTAIGAAAAGIPDKLPSGTTAAGWATAITQPFINVWNGSITTVDTAIGGIAGKVGELGGRLPVSATVGGWATTAIKPFTDGVSAFIAIADTAIGGIAGKITELPSKLPINATLRDWGANVGYQFTGGLNWIANYTGATGMEAGVAGAGQTLAGYLNRAFGPTSALATNMTGSGQTTGNNMVAGIAKGIDPATSNQASVLMDAMRALVDFTTTTVTSKLGIASPSRVMAALFAQVPAGAAVGILAGIPDVRAATRRLAAAVEPGLTGLFGRSEFAVSNERRIVVEFRGQAGGGVPLSAQQFDALKSELAFAIRLGA